MSWLDEPVDRGHVVQSAQMTVNAHRSRPCPSCAPGGCPQLAWAWEQIALLTPNIDRPHPTAGATPGDTP